MNHDNGDLKVRIRKMFDFVKERCIYNLDGITFNDFYIKETIRLGYDDRQLLEGLAFIIKSHLDMYHNPADELFLKEMMPEYEF